MGEAKRKREQQQAYAKAALTGAVGPIQAELAKRMNDLMDKLTRDFPQTYITIFMAPNVLGGRFNYISNANREDMVAMMAAWIAKNDEVQAFSEKLNTPPTDTKN